jgi:hypothetical protein
MSPVARREGLLVRELAGELVVYDLERHEAHCLNRTAAFVFEHHDGRTTASEIAERLRAELNAAADEELVWQAIEQLEKAHLLDRRPPRPELPRVSRRDVVLRIGLGSAILLPAVISVLVPTPAEASATCVPGASCSAGNAGSPCYRFSAAGCGSTCTCQPGSCSSNCCDTTPVNCSY